MSCFPPQAVLWNYSKGCKIENKNYYWNVLSYNYFMNPGRMEKDTSTQKNSLLKLMRVLCCKKWCCDVSRHRNFLRCCKRLSWNSFLIWKVKKSYSNDNGFWLKHTSDTKSNFLRLQRNPHQAWCVCFLELKRKPLVRKKSRTTVLQLFPAPICGGSEVRSWRNPPCLSHISRGKPGVPCYRVLVGARQAGAHRSVADWHKQAVVPLNTLRQLFDVSGDMRKKSNETSA